MYSMSDRKSIVGIDAMHADIPRLYISAETLGNGRDIDPNKIKYGIGIDEMSVPDYHEDSVTLAANAAKSLIKKYDVDIKNIGKLIVGTETKVDQSKPNASYVLGRIEEYFGTEMRNCFAYDINFACAGATLGLLDSISWIKSGLNDNKTALVIASDISKYELNTTGELTQGAGAVAMHITEDPRLLVIGDIFGVATTDNRDFFRPNNRETAVVDGKYSEGQYLNHLKWAFDDFSKKFAKIHPKLVASRPDDFVASESVDYTLFHVPFPKMAEKASSYLMRHEYRNNPKLSRIEEEMLGCLGEGNPETVKEPQRKDFKNNKEFEKADEIHRKLLTKTDFFKDKYASKIAPSLVQPKRVGNIYTGSIYLSLNSVFENVEENLSGKVIGMGSYGSGATAIVFSGIVLPEYEEITSKMCLNKFLEEKRKEVTFEQYESLHCINKSDQFFEENLHIKKIDKSIIPPKREFAFVGVETEEHNEGFRKYERMF